MRVLIAVVWALVCASAFAADEKMPTPQSLQELDAKLGEAFKKANIPGASIAIIENGQVTLAKGYGLADVAKKVPVTPDTVFRAGSISKGFVGVSAMMLVEEGKLDLSARLADVAPEIKFTNRWEATDPVRVMHLMEHTTGFDDIRFSQYLLDGKNMPLRRAIELYGPYESRWRPGMYPSYSNAPPVMAGYIVEKLSGMSWADFTRTRIFEPLGMTSAHWDPAPEIMERLSKSYDSDGVTEQPYNDIPGKPAGSLNVTPSDLARYAIMLASRGTADGKQLLKPESVDRLERPESTLASRLGLKLGYGFGNVAYVRERGVFHGHDGGIDGFLSTFMYEPVHRVGFVIMINAPQVEGLEASELITNYLQRTWPEPQVTPVAMNAADLEKVQGVYQSAPRQQMLAPLTALAEWQPVTVANGKVVVAGKEAVPVGPNLFQRLDRAAPTALFAVTEDGPMLLTSFAALHQAPMSVIAAKAGYGVVFALALVTSALYLLVWVTGWLRGRLADRGGVLVRAVPALALFSVPAFVATLATMLSDESWQSLVRAGTPSFQAQTIYWLTISTPVLGALALLVTLRAGAETPLFTRVLAFVNGALALGAAAYLWQFGWIGLKTWM